MAGPVNTNVRSALVAEAISQIVQGMGEMGLSAQEALIAAETLLWDRIKRTIEASPTPELQDQAKKIGMRAVLRLSSRIEAWPANIEDRS